MITFAKITFGKKVDLVKLISERDKPENVIKKSGQYFANMTVINAYIGVILAVTYFTGDLCDDEAGELT